MFSSSTWVQDTIGLIINGRYNEKKLTLLTTDYLDDSLATEERLEERIGTRLRRRLYQMCKTIRIEPAVNKLSQGKKRTKEKGIVAPLGVPGAALPEVR